MPKQKLAESVLNHWVHTLPFQQQALLLTGVRGPDHNNKYNVAKAIIRYLRGVVIKPAGELQWRRDYQFLNDNDFMWGDYRIQQDAPLGYVNYVDENGKRSFRGFPFWCHSLLRDHDEYPHHFLMHMVHCAEVIGYKHPDKEIANHWLILYRAFCHAFHMTPETAEEMDARLNDFGYGIHSKK